jgi:NAD(P)-dependent dehydrogenase (short-subunit alcohol dehydrogenase family)
MGRPDYGIEGKVFVVTGGSRGIGLDIARELIAQKARVVICARKKEGLDAAVEQIKGGDNLLAVQAHIAKEEDAALIFDAAMKKFGRVDVLINNVGMNLLTASVADTDLATWQKIIESNLTGTFICSKKAARIMKEQKYGRIINISSVAGRKASPGMGIYGIAKAGIEMLTRVLALELAQYNITVNAVAPSMVKTNFSKPFWGNSDIREQIINTIPLKRIAETEDVVHPVLFLSSDKASFITGQVLLVDGGSTV